MIPDDVIQAVKERADILQVVGSLVTLKRAGATYKGLCPFHGEKTASFIVTPQSGTYHCFGCQAHGDSIRFLMESQHLKFPEAVRTLAAELGIPIPETRQLSSKEKRERQEKRSLSDRLFDLQERLTEWYCQSLARSDRARGYLQGREISRASAEAFRLGWASDDIAYFHQWMQKTEASLEDLQRLGVVIPYDEENPKRGDARLKGGRLRFRNRLMCPIFDIQDRVVGFSGRVIDPHQKIAKYLNSPETPIFTKGHHLYGLKTARVAARKTQNKQLILCEGNLDVISLWQAGFPFSVAAMGTAVTEAQSRILKRLSGDLLCMMDGDAAGQKAAFKSLPILLGAQLNVRGRILPDGHDPDSFLQEFGVDSLRDWITEAEPLILTQLKTLAEEHPKDPIGNAAIIKQIIPLIQLIQDEQQRPLYLNEVARVLNVDRGYLTSQMILDFGTKSRKPSLRTSATETKRAQQYRPSVSTSQGEPQAVKADQFKSASEARASSSDHLEYGEEGYPLLGVPIDDLYHGYEDERTHRQEDSWSDEQWWAKETMERAQNQRVKSKRSNHIVTGQIQIKLTPPARPPRRLAVNGDQVTHLVGYEREALSLLFHSPELLSPFIEQDGHQWLSDTLLSEFVLSIQRELTESGYLSGEDFFKRYQQHPLISEIQDCLIAPPIQLKDRDRRKALESILQRLKRGRLQAQLIEVCRRLSATPSPEPEDRAQLLSEYQHIQDQVKALQTGDRSIEPTA